MKRTKRAGLTLMGAAPFLFTACGGGEPPLSAPATAFNSVEECIQSQTLTPDACKAQYDEALQSHQQQAPRFLSRDACETQYGAEACQTFQGSDGTNWFIPAMAGFMVGQALADRRDDHRYSGFGSSYGYRSEPLYRDNSHRGAWRTPDNRTITSSRPGAPVTAVTPSRGGFGSQAAARGTWGS